LGKTDVAIALPIATVMEAKIIDNIKFYFLGRFELLFPKPYTKPLDHYSILDVVKVVDSLSHFILNQPFLFFYKVIFIEFFYFIKLILRCNLYIWFSHLCMKIIDLITCEKLQNTIFLFSNYRRFAALFVDVGMGKGLEVHKKILHTAENGHWNDFIDSMSLNLYHPLAILLPNYS
jgi:hypothetical protein